MSFIVNYPKFLSNKEEKVIPSTIHLNLDVLTTKVDIASNNECNSFDEAQLYFDAAIFRYITSFKLELVGRRAIDNRGNYEEFLAPQMEVTIVYK